MSLNLKFGPKILLTATAVTVLVFSLFAFYNDYRQRQTTQTDLQNTMHNLGTVLGANIDSWLSGRMLLIDGVAQAMALDPSPENVQRLLKEPVMTKTFVAAYVGTAAGQFLIEPARTMPEGFDPRQRPWYKDTLTMNGPILTEPYIGAGTDYLVMTQAVPIKSEDGRVLGALGANLNLDNLAKIINAVDLKGLGYAFLVSADGKILVHPDKTLVTHTLTQVFGEHPPSIEALSNEVLENGQPRIVTFTPVSGLPSVKWYVGFSVDKTKAYAALNEFRWSALIASVIAVLATVALLGMTIQLLLRPLHSMGKAMQDIAAGEGDLTRRLTIVAQDEIGAVAQAFNRFVERIQTSIGAVLHASTQLDALAVRVNEASTSSMNSSSVQAAHTDNVAAAINELGAAAEEIARSAAHTSTQATHAREQTREGRQVVEQNIQAMTELSSRVSHSRQHIEALNTRTVNIGRILDVIRSISDQTNLLALNAAIEAARAGDAGRGFAVVSDEVRSLAHRTQASAQEIHQLIDELQSGSHQAVQAMLESQRHSEANVVVANSAGQRLESVLQGIGEIDELSLGMATATEEQTAVVNGLNRDITHINSLNRDMVDNLQATLQACQELREQSGQLQRLVGTFKI